MLSTLSKRNRVGNFVFIGDEYPTMPGHTPIHTKPIQSPQCSAFDYYPLNPRFLQNSGIISKSKAAINILKVSCTLLVLVCASTKRCSGIFELCSDVSGYMDLFMNLSTHDLFDDTFSRCTCRFKLPQLTHTEDRSPVYVTCRIPVYLACVPCLKVCKITQATLWGIKIIYISNRKI